MSIINEALKKALREKESIPTSTYQDSLKKKFEAELHRRGPRITWKPVFAAVIALLIAGPIVAPFVGHPFKKQTPGPAPQTAELSDSKASGKKSQFGIEEAGLFPAAPMMSMAPKSDFTLNGVLYSQKDSYCIINSKILRVGDSIRGAKLVSISADGAILDLNGRKISLSS